MSALTTTLSSAGTSVGIICDPTKRATTVQLTATSGSSGTNFVQYTLDDPTALGATVVWANLSSAIASSAADVSVPGGVVYSVLTPLGGLRISSSTYTSGTVTLKALQTVLG